MSDVDAFNEQVRGWTEEALKKLRSIAPVINLRVMRYDEMPPEVNFTVDWDPPGAPGPVSIKFDVPTSSLLKHGADAIVRHVMARIS